MVSLGDENRRQGAYFFDHPQMSTEVNHTTDRDELIHDHRALTTGQDPSFRPIYSTGAIVLLIVTMLSLEATILVLPFECTGQKCGISAYYIILYVHASVWFVVMLTDRFLRVQHYYSRRNGYLDFYRNTRHIRRIPFLISSGGNAVLVVVVALLQQYCPLEGPCSTLRLSKSNFLQAVISMEVLVIFPSLIIYLVRTVRFNRGRHAPDAHQDDLTSSFAQANSQSSDIGYRDEDYLDDVLEKQADMIRYLKQHNANLGRKILKLTTELNNRQ